MSRSTGVLAILGLLSACSSGACSGDDAAGRARATLPAQSSTPAPQSSSVVVAPAPPAAAGPAVPVTTAVPVPAPAPTGPVAPLSEDMARPYFASGPASAAATQFGLENWAAARAGFAAHRKKLPAKDAAGRARATLMIALCDAELSHWPAAAQGFAEAAPKLPVLADWLTYQEARARYLAHQVDRALAMARRIAPDSIVAADAELLVGDILRGQGDAAAIAAHYRDYLARRPAGIRRPEAAYRLGEALERVAGDDARAEMVATYRRIGIEAPLSSWGTRAAERLAALRPRLPAALAATIDNLSAGEHITRGKELFDSMRNPESEAEFAAALTDPAIAPADACVAAYHRAQSRFKARDRTGAAPLFDAAQAACKTAGDKDLEIKSAYNGGRSYAFIGKHAIALDRYRAAQLVDPAHSYGDDALLREAEELADLGQDDKASAALARIPTRFPDGDMRAEALWRLGWRAWRKDDLPTAIKWWRKQIESVPIDDNYWGEGQAQYWIGRALARQKQLEPAIASYESAIRTYPLSYYALLALNRLQETAPDRYQAMLAEIGTDPPGFDAGKPSFTFQPRTEWATPGFRRAMELLRLGLGDPAEAELRKLGLVAPDGKKRVDDPDLVEKLWAIAFLYDRAGKHGQALWPTRWHILDYRRQWPVGDNRARWRIAYPKDYWELLEQHAKKNGVPVELQIGIVREESGFDPLRESFANAIGLTQMIAPTAKRFAKGTGIVVSRETLRDPEKNVIIGSRFLGFLVAKWQGFIHLVPPSYNAGEGYVARNLKTRGTWPADEFIEGIIDDTIRNYSKRVLSSYFTYAWLYGPRVPEMPNQIPPGIVPRPTPAAAPAAP